MQYFWTVLLCFLGIRDVSLSEEQDSWKGIQPKRLEPRITHGHNASLGQFPWQVYIRAELFTKDNYNDHCGGSLIDKEWILTAAHCLEKARHVDIFLGSTKDPNIEDSTRIKLQASEVYIHPKYDKDDDDNLYDIALIKLQTPVEFNKMIQRIKLANKRLPQFSQVIASGWGKTHDAEGSIDLIYAHMITLPNQICKIDPPNISGKLCAVSKKVPREIPCVGDSGGPLFDNATGTPFLVGITSYGLTSCKTNILDFFTDVYSFKDWIEDTIKKHRTPIN